MRLAAYPDQRPATRGECHDMPRPCPFLSCKWHLAHAPISPHAKPPLDDDEAADLIVGMKESCALDVADRPFPPTATEASEMTGVSMQAVQSTERRALYRISTSPLKDDLSDSLREVDRQRASRPDFDQDAPGGDLLEWGENKKVKVRCWEPKR